MTASTEKIDPGAGIVVRGLLLFGFLLLVLVGGYFLLVRRPGQDVPAVLLDPEPLIGQLVMPGSAFPATLQWGPAERLAEALPSPPGWQIRYTAARNLAYRGSAHVPWDIFVEMLDEPWQFRNFRVRLQDGRLVPDEAAARQIIVSGLKAVAQWHEKQAGTSSAGPELRRVHAAIAKLAQSPVPDLRMQAEKTLLALKAKQ